MTTQLYIPTDMDEAYEEYNANCGPCALAAFVGKPVREVMPAFGADWPGYTNSTMMRLAAGSLGVPLRILPKGQWPKAGLVWIELVGPWSRPGIPIGAQLAHSHWVCLRSGQVFDPIPRDWRQISHWESSVMPEWVAETNRATGWRIRLALQDSSWRF